MKKKSKIQQKNKLKIYNNFKYLKLARFSCVMLVVLFLVYIAVNAQALQVSYQEIISENPVYLIGFLICAMNLYIWYLLKKFTIQMQELKNIDSIRIHLILLMIVQVFLLNFASAGLIALSLWKYFRWNHICFSKLIQDLKLEKQILSLGLTSLLCCFSVMMVYQLYFALY